MERRQFLIHRALAAAGTRLLSGQTHELLAVLLADARIRIIEISEYAALRDLDQAQARKLVDLLCMGLQG